MNEDKFQATTWENFYGQQKLKDRLDIHMSSAYGRMEPLDHILLLAPPGCGKTTIAKIIASKMEANFQSYMAPVKPAVLRTVVAHTSGVVLIDEIHRMPPRQQESLLPLIQDGYLQFDNGVKIESTELTIIGASTEPDKLIAPLIDRFPIRPTFEDYSDDELALILQSMAERVGVSFTPESALILGRAAGGIPRNARSIVVMARDLGSTDPHEILRCVGLTEDGLNDMHIAYLKSLADCGYQAGLDILSAHTRMPKPTLVDLERLLVRRHMIEYSKGGRQLMPAGSKALKKVQS